MYMSYQENSISTAPTITIVPRSLQMSSASLQGDEDFEAAATITQSAPRPFVIALTSSLIDTPPSRPASTPNFRANATRSDLKSMPITRAPCSRANCATSCPTKPKPTTATTSPTPTSEILIELRAILPSVVKHACWNGTSSGTWTTRLREARIVCPWPVPSPPYATRSPTLKSVTDGCRSEMT